MYKFNKNNEGIAKNNLMLLAKLENVRSSLNVARSEDEGSCRSFVTPFMRKRIEEREKENMRMSNKMRNMCSALNQKNFIKDYAKSQQIKSRIMRYTTEESRVYLKSQKYF